MKKKNKKRNYNQQRTPSWFVQLFSTKPARRDRRDKLKKIDLKTDCDGLIFMDQDKSVHWTYW